MDQLTKIKELISPLLEKEGIVLYDVLWQQEGKSRILQIAIMRNDGSMDIDTCAEMSEKISELLDEKDMIASEYFLEVCSPGAERELRNKEQILDAVGKFVYVKLRNPKAGLDEVKGTLTAFENDVVLYRLYGKSSKEKNTNRNGKYFYDSFVC